MPKNQKENIEDKRTEETNTEQNLVQVSTEQLQGLINSIEELKKSNQMLLQIADKKQLATYYGRNQKELPKIVRLRTMSVENKDGVIENKVITGWKTVLDEVYQDPVTMRWTEKQKVKILFEDGTSNEYWLMDYVRLYKQVEASIVSKTTDEETGDVMLKVRRLDDGREYNIGLTFIN